MLSRRRVLAGLSAASMGLAQGCAVQEPARAAPRPTGRLQGARVIDFHSHMLEPSLMPVGAPAASPTARAQTDIAQRVADMDRLGIDLAVVAHNSVTQGISWGDARHDLDVYRRINDRLAEEYQGAHPGRLTGAFGLPTQDMNLALAEMERAVTRLGFRVLQISSCTADGVYYGDPRLDPFWEAVQAFDLTVFIHPHGQMRAPPLDQFRLNIEVGQSIEEAKVMSSIIYQGVFDKFPRLKILMAHGGGFLVHYPGRIDRDVGDRAGTPPPYMRSRPSDYFSSFYYDTCVYTPSVMAEVVRIVGADRIVLGSDYPVGPADPVGTLRATPGVRAADLQRMMTATPAALLRL